MPIIKQSSDDFQPVSLQSPSNFTMLSQRSIDVSMTSWGSPNEPNGNSKRSPVAKCTTVYGEVAALVAHAEKGHVKPLNVSMVDERPRRRGAPWVRRARGPSPQGPRRRHRAGWPRQVLRCRSPGCAAHGEAATRPRGAAARPCSALAAVLVMRAAEP